MVHSSMKVEEIPLTRGYRNTRQQLPKKSAKYIRNCIVPKPGHCFIAADYAGQEIRILAAYSGDEKLIQAYDPCYRCEHNKDPLRVCQFGKCPVEDHTDLDSKCNVLDIHSYICKQLHGDAIDVPISAIKDHPVFGKWRDIAKAVTFSLNSMQGLRVERPVE